MFYSERKKKENAQKIMNYAITKKDMKLTSRERHIRYDQIEEVVEVGLTSFIQFREKLKYIISMFRVKNKNACMHWNTCI